MSNNLDLSTYIEIVNVYNEARQEYGNVNKWLYSRLDIMGEFFGATRTNALSIGLDGKWHATGDYRNKGLIYPDSKYDGYGVGSNYPSQVILADTDSFFLKYFTMLNFFYAIGVVFVIRAGFRLGLFLLKGRVVT